MVKSHCILAEIHLQENKPHPPSSSPEGEGAELHFFNKYLFFHVFILFLFDKPPKDHFLLSITDRLD